MDSIIFLHTKGAQTRRRIVQSIYRYEKQSNFHSLTTLTDLFDISKVAVKKHVDNLADLGYIEKINPGGKPIFLRLTDKGTEVAKKYILI